MTRRALASIFALGALAGTAACDGLLGLDKVHDGVCAPGVKVRCTLPGTDDGGVCQAAFQTCNDDGQSFGDCELDQTGCCPGAKRSCYTGPDGTENAGICKAGTQTCAPDGKSYGACTGDVKPAQETCASTKDEDCDGRECVEWTVLFGDATDQFVTGVAIDPAGNIYVTGFFYGTINIHGMSLVADGQGDAFLLKLGPTGEALWGKSFGDNGMQSFDTIAIDNSGAVFLGGRSDSPINLGGSTLPEGLFVAKFDADGKHVWSRGLTTTTGCVGSDSNIFALAVTAQGDPVIGGYYCGTIDFGAGPVSSKGRDAFVAKMRGSDGAGNVAGAWNQTFGDTALQEINRVAIDPMGNIVAAGSFQGTIQLGSSVLTANDGYDGIIEKLDPTGGLIWYERIGGMKDQNITDLALDATGGPIVTGSFEGNINISGLSTAATGTTPNGFVVRYGSDQSYAWSKLFPTAMLSVSVDASNKVTIVGHFVGSIDLGDGPLMAGSSGFATILAKLESGGSVAWKRVFSANQAAGILGPRIVNTATGESVVAGSMSGTLDVGGGALMSAGTLDIFVAKFAP